MDEQTEKQKRHPFRFLFKAAILGGLVYGAGRFVKMKKTEFADLTESQARDKLVDKMGPKVGEETANEIADKVIPKLKDRGLIKPDLADTDGD
jgi:hypothetical protein